MFMHKAFAEVTEETTEIAEAIFAYSEACRACIPITSRFYADHPFLSSYSTAKTMVFSNVAILFSIIKLSSILDTALLLSLTYLILL
jgi:serine protease inhibitor